MSSSLADRIERTVYDFVTESSLGAFGERMQRERELRGVTLEEISVVTKIGTRSLKALEEEDFDKLPGGIFNKGFVRAYARYLGIDPDEAVADYLAAIEGRNRPAFESPTVAPVPAGEPGPEFATVEEPESSYGSLVFAGIVVVLAIAIGGWWILSGRGPSLDSIKRLVQRQGATETPTPGQKQSNAERNGTPSDETRNRNAAREVPPPAPVQGRAPVLADVNPAILSPAAKAADERAARAAAEKAAAQKAAEENKAAKPGTDLEPEVTTSVATVPEGAGFTVQLRAAEETWVTVTADGKQVAKGILAPGDERSIRAGRRVIVHVGNAAGVQVAFNGKPLPALGAQGEVKTLAFGPNGREVYTPPLHPPESPAAQPAANVPNPQ